MPWHYTLASKLASISRDKHIKRATIGVLKPERRAVWFTPRLTWEPTATTHFRDGGSGVHWLMLDSDGPPSGTLRFTVSAALAID